uniref:Uncharacterized protein n=1 Tax=Ditylenchus dipsaci TaxID=166011 RepID=A0A915CQV5_9BILA
MPQRCSITCDVWSDRGLNNSYLGVTLHYCDQDLIRRETEFIVDTYRVLLRKSSRWSQMVVALWSKVFETLFQLTIQSAFPLRIPVLHTLFS